MVEFALILPILALLLVMAIDFGRVFFGWVALNNAARIGADFAAGEASAWPADNPLDAQAQTRYQSEVVDDLNAINCSPVAADDDDGNGRWDEGEVPDPQFPDGKDTGDRVILLLDCRFQLLTPLAQAVLGGPVSLNAEATFYINSAVVQAIPTPVPTATPTPTPVLTPTPAPSNCTVPNTVGGDRNTARNLWVGRGFVLANLTEDGSGNFTVGSQSRTANSSIPCNSSMTIAQSTTLTPAPTPTPAGPTPVPTPVPPPTPVPCETPVASLTATPIQGRSPLLVSFTDTSQARNCPILSWSWNWGDGTPNDTTQNAQHTFTHPGPSNTRQFTVTLTVTSEAGPAQATQTITVQKP